jgi:hypothetical protein
MRHGWTVVPALLVLGLGAFVYNSPALGGEPLDERLGIRTAPIFLLSRSDVQADLKLNPTQIAECRRDAAVLHRKALALKGKTGPAMAGARRAIDEEMGEWLVNHLTSQQLDRLDQLVLQWEGPSAMLSRLFLNESLNLSADQREKLSRYLVESNAQRDRRFWTYDDHHNLNRKALGVLTERQRHLWVRILGEPCVFTVGVKPATLPNTSQSVSSVPPRPVR